MHQHPSDSEDRMKAAAENLARILRELAPYEHKPKVEEISTAGTWRATDQSLPQLVTAED